MAINPPSALISAIELMTQIDKPHLRILDASWHMPSYKRDAWVDYNALHIAGAGFFDIDGVRDVTSPYPHMLPSAAQFSDAMSALGIANDSLVVVYDTQGLFSAPRLWWMLRVFGHENVRVLDGGLPAWIEVMGAISSQPTNYPATEFTAQYVPELIADASHMLSWSKSGERQICDARSPNRFFGREPEPRAGVRSGHIPNAKNIHYSTLLNKDGTLKSPDALRIVFASAHVDISQPIATSCGSGVTACILALALYELGYPNTPVYDGSWAQWGVSDYPVSIT